MDALRRMRYPVRLARIAMARPRRVVRLRRPRLGLRGAERRLVNALVQLREGVPLNWGQVEDDAELETLAFLQRAAQECREHRCDVPPELRATLIEELSARLPEWQPEPAKAPPRSLAGFSERVQVLTQVEEDVPPLISRVPQWLFASVLSSGAVVLLLWALASFFFRTEVPTYNWIAVTQEGRTVARQQLPAGYVARRCQGHRVTDPEATRSFVKVPLDRRQIQERASFQVEFLPATMSLPSTTNVPLTYTLRLINATIAPCAGDAPDAGDPGGVVKLEYVARNVLESGAARSSTLVVFQGRERPVTLEVGSGSWKEVQVGKARGVLVLGGPYRDIEGNQWIGRISVMALEREGIVTTIIGQSSQVVDEVMLLALAREIEGVSFARQTETARPIPSFAWIELTRSGKVLSASRPPPAGPASCDVATPLPTATYRQFAMLPSREEAQRVVGYPIISLPPTSTMTSTVSVPQWATVQPQTPGAMPQRTITSYISETVYITFTQNLADVWVMPCAGRQPQAGDQGATTKLRYSALRAQSHWGGQPGGGQPAFSADIIIFQARRQLTSLDVTAGRWEEIKLGEVRGVFWSGSGYRDVEGSDWPEGTSVMLLERGDTLLTFISVGATYDRMLDLAKHIQWND